ncbi:hypothetical protein C1646_750828 [Rhizophagus diaphanus]|nr:hypothetical protein C1646_750828 [Rhizophagus diaphanus] [Rhizophagus sp. MUCL 43196]
MDEKPIHLWNYPDTNRYQDYITISTNDSTIKLEDVDERVVYIEDFFKKNKHIEYVQNVKNLAQDTFDLSNPENSSDLSFFQISSVSEYLDLQLNELKLNEIYQDSEHNIK